MAREDEIRLIAYNIWEEEGCLDGHDCEYWFKAETIWEQRQKSAAQRAEAEPKQTLQQKRKVTGKKRAAKRS